MFFEKIQTLALHPSHKNPSYKSDPLWCGKLERDSVVIRLFKTDLFVNGYSADLFVNGYSADLFVNGYSAHV